MSSSPTLLTPTSKPSPLPLPAAKPTTVTTTTPPPPQQKQTRRQFLNLTAATTLTTPLFILSPPLAFASDDEEYVKDTEGVISKVRTTINMDKTDPNVATAVAELRDLSNSWVSKYRREKALLGRASYRDIYSALNAVSGHYISFGPTAPIPAKRKARILEEMDSAEKALLRGR